MSHPHRGRARGVVVITSLLVLLVASLSGASAFHEPSTAPNDPTWEKLQWGPRQVRVQEAWHRTSGDGVLVAVVDNGVDRSHEDLGGRVVPGQTFVDCGDAGCGDGSWFDNDEPDDYPPHGTHVAGIIAASRSNGLGIAGIAPAASILPVRVLSPTGGSFPDIARGIRYATDRGAKVINMSIGGLPGYQALVLTGLVTDVSEAIDYANSRGAIVVVASGNEFFRLCAEPSFDTGALCVTATDKREARSAYSNDPVKPDLLSVAAPGGSSLPICGEAIISTVPAGEASAANTTTCGWPSNRAYEESNGTSMAAPHVAGVATLLVSMGCTRAETLALLTETARQPGPDAVRGTWTPAYGYGIVDATAATAEATSRCNRNTAPDAQDDAFTVLADEATPLPVLANDTDAEGDELSIAILQAPAHGVAEVAGGKVLYTPRAGFVGSDLVTYEVRDSRGLLATAKAVIRVRRGCGATLSESADGDPFASGWRDDTPVGALGWTTVADPALPDASGNRAFFSDAANAAAAKDSRLVSPLISVVAGTTVSFEHRFATEEGFDGGVLEASTDGGHTWSDIGSEATANGYSGTIDATTTSPIAGRSAWTGTSLPVRVVVPLGRLAGSAVTLRWRLVQDTNAGGVGWWVDGIAVDGTRTECPNEPPVANADRARTVPGRTVTFSVTANDYDVDGDAFIVSGTSASAGGSVACTQDGTCTFTPEHPFTGGGSFDYEVCDERGACAVGAASISVGRNGA